MNEIIDVKAVESQTAPSATTPVHTDNDRTVMHVLYGLHTVAWASGGMLAVIALAVLREGSEIVLFLYGMAASGANRLDLLAGLPLGLASGTAVGFALYFGLLRIPLRHFFAATNWMLVLLAAGLSSSAAGFLIQADWLSAWGNQLWNTSWLLDDGSLFGQALHVLVGYEAHPSGMQLTFWLVTAMVLFTGMRLMEMRQTSASTKPSQATPLGDATSANTV